jgi:hypothetical protein
MPAPIPVVAPITDLLALPVGGTVSLSGSGGLPSAQYQWTLIEKPDGSNALLNNANTATPTLVSVDKRGTYIVFLRITDSGGSSHPYPYPTQATSAPYGFTAPLASAFGVVRVAETSGLFKPGRGEYGWFEKGLWPIIDQISAGTSFAHYDENTHTLDADAIVPSTAEYVDVNTLSVRQLDSTTTQLGSTVGNVVVASPVEVNNPSGITASAGPIKTAELRSLAGANLAVNVDQNLLIDTVSATLEASDAVDVTAGGLLALASNAGDVSITAGDDITLAADDDIICTAEDDMTLTAKGDILAQGTNSATLYAGSPSTGVATVYGKKSTAGTDSVVIRGEARIKLQAVDTYSDTPVRAPGLVGCELENRNSTTSLPANPGSPYYALFDKPFSFTRHTLGSRLDLDLTVLGVVDKQQVVVRIRRVTSAAGDVTLDTITSHTPSINGAKIVIRVRISTSLCPDNVVLTHIQADIGDQTGALHETVHKFLSESLSAADTSANIDFYVDLNRAATTYLQHAAQGTATLYANHTQDVI